MRGTQLIFFFSGLLATMPARSFLVVPGRGTGRGSVAAIGGLVCRSRAAADLGPVMPPRGTRPCPGSSLVSGPRILGSVQAAFVPGSSAGTGGGPSTRRGLEGYLEASVRCLNQRSSGPASKTGSHIEVTPSRDTPITRVPRPVLCRQGPTRRPATVLGQGVATRDPDPERRASDLTRCLLSRIADWSRSRSRSSRRRLTRRCSR